MNVQSTSNHNRNYLSDDLTLVQVINKLQPVPDVWLGFLQSKLLHLPEGINKRKILNYFYVQAKQVLDLDCNKTNKSLAKILVYEAIHIGIDNPSDARELFEEATIKLRRVPFIHLAYAQFELDQGRKNKAVKILKKGMDYTQNDNLICSAISKLNSGEDNILTVCKVRHPTTNNVSCTSPTDGMENRNFHFSVPFQPLHTPLNNITNSSVVKVRNKKNFYQNAKSFSPISASKYVHQSQLLKKTPIHLAHHTISEALDLPCSPCTPEINAKIKPGLLKTPKNAINRGFSNTISVSTPKTPQLQSSTKSFSSKSCFSAELFQLPFSTRHVNKESTKSDRDYFGKPQRVLRSMQNADSDEEPDCIQTAKTSFNYKQQSQSPIIKHLPPVPQMKKLDEMPPPSVLPIHSTGEELRDWKKVEVITIHERSYSIIKEIGTGGSSKVYQVRDVTSNAIKALKQVNLKDCDKLIRDGFVNEIKFLQRLKGNRTIIELYDYMLTENFLFMVMECGSIDMAQFLRKKLSHEEKLEPYEIWYFWKKMLKAVKTIHDHGVIHLDLKPANFLLVEGNVKLIDFGIANAIQADATSIIKDTQCGTLNYMAPESILDMSGSFHSSSSKFKISPRADVWSLGCILHLMMYGRTPFQHITNQPIKINAITNPACKLDFEDFSDKQLLAVVASCLRRDPKQRPTVEQLLK